MIRNRLFNAFLLSAIALTTATANAATIYVATNGNDTTGDGSSGTPYATVNKAFTVAAAGDTISVADGTYSENTPGWGCLNLNRAFASYVTIQSTSGTAANVILQGTTDAYVNVLVRSSAAYIKFKNLTLRNYATTSREACTINKGDHIYFDHVVFNVQMAGSLDFDGCLLNATEGAISNVTFDTCTFTKTGTTSSQLAGVRLTSNATYATSGVAVTGSTIFQDGFTPTGTSYGVLVATATTPSISNVTISNNLISGYTAAVGVIGCTGLAISGNELIGQGNAYALMLGNDEYGTNYPTQGTVTANVIRTTGPSVSHAVLVGQGCNASLTIGGSAATDANIISGGNYGIVIKNCDGPTIRGNVVAGGSSAVILCKSAHNATIDGNALSGVKAGTYILMFSHDAGSGLNNANHTFTNNRITTAGQIAVYNIPSSYDDGGHIVNANTICRLGSGNYGAIGATSGIATLAAARTAWATAGITNGDQSTYDATALPVSPDDIANAILDAPNGVETGKTLRQTLRIVAAVLAGEVSGARTGTETFKGIDGATPRATVHVDAHGNRTSVTLTP